MNLGVVSEIVSGVAGLADDLFTSDEERLKIRLQEKQIDADLAKAQVAVNAAEATHKSILVAGWRPAIGWVGVVAMAYQFVIYPLLLWVWAVLEANGFIPDGLTVPPMLPTDALFAIITGMLGIGGMRSFDKSKGTQTDKLK